jgi:23S rRNA (guanosine2251-2'-O)-methyltransferase
MRKTSKGPSVGTGGHNRRRLEGKGPTPKAQDRTGHPAKRRADAATGAGGQGGRAAGPGAAASRRRAPRREGGPEYVAGRNPVVEALQAGVPVNALYVQTGIDGDDRVRAALALANDTGIPILEATRTDLDRLTAAAVHQGLALQVPAYEYAHPMDLLDPHATRTLVVALDRITDPRNLGAVVRSAAAFGGNGVVVPARRSAGVTAAAWKASAGALVRVPVALATNLTRALSDYRRAGLLVVGLDSDGDLAIGELQARHGTAERAVCLVIGAESEGLGRLVRETCDVVVSVPMSAGTESLNASVAAGIALFHLRR